MASGRQPPYALPKWRLWLRVTATILASLGFILDLTAMNCQGQYYSYSTYIRRYCTPPLVGLSVAPIGLAWNSAEFITHCVNKRGIHPGAHIALDLIILGAYAGTPIDIYLTLESNTAISAAVFMELACIIHFVLFVLDCIAVHKWRKAKKAVILPIVTANHQPVANLPARHDEPMNLPGVVTVPDALPCTPVPVVSSSYYSSLPPPPPGMVYLVPIPGASGQNPPEHQDV